jgi:hypothetical protein
MLPVCTFFTSYNAQIWMHIPGINAKMNANIPVGGGAKKIHHIECKPKNICRKFTFKYMKRQFTAVLGLSAWPLQCWVYQTVIHFV